jgi:hypothetical protein
MSTARRRHYPDGGVLVVVGGHMTLGPDPSMTPKEEEEYLLLYGPRKERKALKKRRKAEQEALKKQSRS